MNIAGQVQPLIHQYTQVFLPWAVLSLLLTQSVSIGNEPTQIQDLTLRLLELHEDHMGHLSIL